METEPGSGGDAAVDAAFQPAELRRPRWGDPAASAGLSESALAALHDLGITAGQPVREPTLPPPLDADTRQALEAVVGAEAVSCDDDERIGHTRGYSTTDLLRLRSGDATDAPDAVVFPASHQQVCDVLATCSERRVAVVPFSGGTSVVGGLAAQRAGFHGVITLDLRRMAALASVDEESHVAVFQAGIRGIAAERLLNERGLTLGHFPQSFEGASLGGYAATRSAGQASTGYGRFDDLVVRLKVATPKGTVEAGLAPKSAAGPDLRQVFLGSEGALGVITEIGVRVRPAPSHLVYESWSFASFEAGTAALRRVAQEGPHPAMLRLSDEAETAIERVIAGPDPAAAERANADPGAADAGAADAGAEDAGSHGACASIVGYEGTQADVVRRREAVHRLLETSGGSYVGTGPGDAWLERRYRAPYLRDAVLDAGGLVETLETATFWSNLPALRDAVLAAVTRALTDVGTPGIVMSHVSHVYDAGASLYFTVVCAQAPDPVTQWRIVKQAANEAIVAAGGTISHHHGVGTDHKAAYAAEIGPLMVEALRAMKHSLDPQSILNPGVLLDV